MTVAAAALAPFLDAILAEPEADGPQLILADYLEDHGDPRGPRLREGVQWLARVAALGVPANGSDVPELLGLSPRQSRLFAVACVRHAPCGGAPLWALLPTPSAREAVALAALAAAGLATEGEVEARVLAATRTARGMPWSRTWALATVARAAGGSPADAVWAAHFATAVARERGGDPAQAVARRWQAAVATLVRSLSA
jgi:uncharacterized protein (TIGR02996 family)